MYSNIQELVPESDQASSIPPEPLRCAGYHEGGGGSENIFGQSRPMTAGQHRHWSFYVKDGHLGFVEGRWNTELVQVLRE